MSVEICSYCKLSSLHSQRSLLFSYQMLKLLMIYGHGIQLWLPVDPLLNHLSNSVVISLVTLLFASTVELLLPHFIIHVNTCVYSSTLSINISPKYMHTHIYHTSNSRECMSQACSCTQFMYFLQVMQELYQYYKSCENPYHYYKSCENRIRSHAYIWTCSEIEGSYGDTHVYMYHWPSNTQRVRSLMKSSR